MHKPMLLMTFGLTIAASAAFSQSTPLDASNASSGYVERCKTQMVDIPIPFGESDLKGNPKLDSYCQCFSDKFIARLKARLQTGGPAPPAKQSIAEEHAMRNDCRQSLGLPLLKFSTPP